MFVAALIDAFPQFQTRVMNCVKILKVLNTSASIRGHRDALHQGRRFHVKSVSPHQHDHKTFTSIKGELKRAALSASTRVIALEIFQILAGAEAKVHRVDAAKVTFHEIGAWDSIIDIVAAADLIGALADHSLSIGVLPLGSGRIRTAHGIMPVPAPATLELLRGFEVMDDGVPGERVTPTGMAILCYLKRHGIASRPKGAFVRCGIGFGSIKFPQISNILRVMIMQTEKAATGEQGGEDVSEICFDIDDQSPEDLAIALDHIRDNAGVFSVIQIPAFGKKGRMVTQVQIMGRPAVVDSIIAQCLNETTTLGLRVAMLRRVVLPRSSLQVPFAGRVMNVKVARRPTGKSTAKIENDDILLIPGRENRTLLRRKAEQFALKETRADARSRSRK